MPRLPVKMQKKSKSFDSPRQLYFVCFGLCLCVPVCALVSVLVHRECCVIVSARGRSKIESCPKKEAMTVAYARVAFDTPPSWLLSYLARHVRHRSTSDQPERQSCTRLRRMKSISGVTTSQAYLQNHLSALFKRCQLSYFLFGSRCLVECL